MSKTGSANGSFFGNFIYDQLLRRRPHFPLRSLPGRGLFLCQGGPERLLRWVGPGPFGPGAHVQDGVLAISLRSFGQRHRRAVHLEHAFQVFPGSERRRIATRPHRSLPLPSAPGSRGVSVPVQSGGGAGPNPRFGVRLSAHHRRHPHDCQGRSFCLKQEHQDGDDDDHYGDWRGFHHHATPCIAAYGFLVAEHSSFSLSGPDIRPSFTIPQVPAGWQPRRSSPRPEQHSPSSIATIRRKLMIILSNNLSRCPRCHRGNCQ
jgi:hypothetical protein